MSIVISKISMLDLPSIANIGKICLPIYYTLNDLVFILFKKSYIMYKISYYNKIVGFIIGNEKLKPNLHLSQLQNKNSIDTKIDLILKDIETNNTNNTNDTNDTDNIYDNDGICTIKRQNNLINRIHIMSIGILPDYRKMGFGSLLINKLKNYAKENYSYKVKLSLFVLTNNIPAIKLYEKNGFEKKYKDDEYYETLPIKSAFYYET